MNTITEELECARQAADHTRLHLQRALRTATAVEALVLLPLIQQANTVLAGVESLQHARSEA